MFRIRIERLQIVNWYIYYIHQTAFEIVLIVLIKRLWLSQQDWQLNFCILLDQSCSVNQFTALELSNVFSFIAFTSYIHQTAFQIVPIVLMNRLGLSQEDLQLNFCIL